MNIEKKILFQGNKIKIIKMVLNNDDNQLQLSWEICFENEILLITFYNVSRFRFGEVSMPLEIHGFEIINHSLDFWDKDSTYEIRDFEDDCIHFFCEKYIVDD